ncbi:EF-hand domain [Paracoccaceae bacterium]
MTRNFKPAAVLVIALMGATISTAAVAERGPMGGMMGMPSFEELDVDKDGQITKEELAARHAARFTQADADKDGKLSAEELIAMREAAEAGRKAERAKAMMAQIDTDADGFVSAAEMEAMPMIGRMFDKMDDNADGTISKDEMDAVQARMAEHRGQDRGHGKGHGMGHGKEGGGFWGWMSDNN